MSKNRSAWSTLLAVVLAMVVMAGLAVTSFAETDSELTLVTDRENLVAVLNGEAAPTKGVNYDVDGNGIVEMDDLNAFDGTQEDLLPNGQNDWLADADTSMAVFGTAIVRGDSTKAMELTAKTTAVNYMTNYGMFTYTTPQDLSAWKELTFDTFWTNGVGTVTVTLYSSSYSTHSVVIQATEAGWTTNVIDLLEVPANIKSDLKYISFQSDSNHEAYVDNLQTNIELVYVPVNFNSDYGSAAGVEVIPGTPYGELPELVHTFKTFEGWYLDQAYTQKVTADTIVAAGAEHTLYAKWSNVVGEDGKITVTEKGNNTFELKQDYANYKQIRFNFTLASGSFSMDYTDGDDVTHNDPIVAIVDVNGNTVQPSEVKAGVEYTAVIHGGSVITTAGIITAGEISGSGTLQFAANAELKITNLEAIGGQLGFTMIPPQQADWVKVDLTDYGYSYGYKFIQDASNKWDTRIGVNLIANRYTQFSFDFYLFDIKGDGKVWFTPSVPVTIYDAKGNEVAGTTRDNTQLAEKTWYTAVFNISGKTGSQYLYFFDEANDTRNNFNMYVANVFFKGDDAMIDNLAPSVTVAKTTGDGTFVTTPITRDTDRGTYRVAGTSASWTDRALKVTMNDPSKDLVQMDIRFLTSKDANGKDVAPTLTVSSSVSGAIKTAQYVILDENDVPVTAMETGKWYRLFITTAGGNAFAVVPAISGEVELQVKNLDAFQADELAMSMVSDNTNVGTASIILTRFGKLEYAYAGTDANSASIRLNSNLYKQVRFSFQLKDRVTTLSMTGATLVVKDASGNTVSMATLQPNTWYTAVIFNGGNALPQSLTLNIAGKTSLLIKDVAGYQTMDDPSSATMSDKYHGLEADEMMIAGFVGPRGEEYVVSYRYDQKTGNLPSMARDDIFKMLSDAGFNYIIDHGLDYAGAGVESVGKLLRLASKYGINYFVHATDIAEVGTVVATDTSSGSTVNTYKNNLADWDVFSAKLDGMTQYDSFGGLYLRDEPSADLFEIIRDARIRVTEWYNGEKGTTLNVFSNLLPGVGSHRWTNGKGTITVGNKSYKISTWQDYISAYEDIVDPDYMMVDMYPFAGDAGVIEGTFIEYISRMAKTAQDQGKDWMGCVQVGGGELAYGAKRVANEYETNWDVNAMLAFGVRGLTYYTMVSAPYFGGAVSETDPAYNDHSLLNIKGEKTVYYDYAKKINAQVQAIDHILMNASQIGVIFVGDQLTYTGGTGNNNAPYNYADKCNDTQHIPQITASGNTTGGKKYSDVKLSNVTGDHVMIGAFSYDGTIALYVVNNDIIAREGNDTSDNIQLSFTGSYAYEIIQDGLTSWQTGNAVNLNLELGHAAMIVLRDAGSVNMDASVFFNLNYETSAPAPETIIIPLDGTYPELPALKRDFYTFEGWYLNAEGTGEAVKEGDALAIQGSHILYAKWTYHEDNNPLQFNLNTEKDHVSITRQYIDGVETYVYTTEGKTLVNAAWQRRIGFVLGDTSKEVVKFRMKVVSSMTEAGETVNPDFYFYAGGLADVNSSHMVLVDENGNVVHTAEVGKWYTVYARTMGKTDLALFVANSLEENLLSTIHIQDRELLDYEPEVGIMAPSHSWYGEVTPYQDAEGNWLVHHRSFTGEHHANTADNRKLQLKNPNGFATVSFEFKYNVSQYAEAGAELADNVAFRGLSLTYFDMNGMPVTESNLKVGQWYRAVVGGTPAASTHWYAMGYADGKDGKTVNIDMDFRNIVGYNADTNPVGLKSRDNSNLVTTYFGNGYYNINTITASAPGTAAWQWAAWLSTPDTNHKYVAVTFRFNAAYAADGVTPIDPTLSIWRGSDAGSGVVAQIYDVATGAQVSSDNGHFKTLEIGKWYTVVIENPAGALQTGYRFTPCYKYSGKAMFSIDICDRAIIGDVGNGVTVTTPDSYSDPYAVYNTADGWHYTIFDNGATYNAWQRRTDFGGATIGAKSVEFEVRINSVSGGCTTVLGTTATRREFYDIETGEYLGYDNNVTLEAGKWYKVVATNGDQGALIAAGEDVRCYPGNPSKDGNVSVSFRNFKVTYPDRVEVSFNLNYEGATDAPATILVAEGSAYGTLPTPTREGFSFIGWFTEAECTNKVTETTIVTAEHTLYAKWDENTAVDPILTAVNSSLLKKATDEQKAAAGIAAAQNMYVYTKYVNTSSDNLGDAAVYFSNQEGYNYITFDFYYADMTAGLQEGRPYLNLKAYKYLTDATGESGASMLDSDLELVVINHRTGEITHEYPNVIDGAHTWGLVDLNTWYTVTVKTADWGRVNFAIWTSGAANVYFTNIYGHDEFTAPDPVEGPTISAARPDQLSVATKDQLAAAGILDTSSTIFRYTKITGVDAAGSRIYLENRNSDAYVTFDVRYSAFNNTSDPGAGVYLLVHDGANYLATGNGGMIVVKKGTETQAGVFSGVYNVLELNTWYTVAIPVQNLSSLYMCFNGADTATLFISNIVWGDEPVFAPILGEDTNLLQPSYTTETSFTGVSRELIGDKETIIFTTEGKNLTNTGWQRRLEFVNSDTTKEVVKFRFKYVANNDAEGNAVTPAIGYYVNGLADTNTGHFTVTDENGNVVAPTALETGKWYIFYGRTQGHSKIVFYPCSTTTQLRTTLYIQDREVLDFEEPIYVQQASHAYRGSTAPYQDKDGNWLIHFRSFTGEHHDNTAEGRQTDIHFNGTYTAATFEFKFNVSQYAASGEALADKINIADLLNATYFDMDGNIVTTSQMVVGQWYRAVMVASAGSTLPAYDRFYIQGYTNGNSGNTVNIDMDMRNFVGLESEDDNGIRISTPSSLADPCLAYNETDGWYYFVPNNGSTLTAEQRQMKITIPTDGATRITYEIRIDSLSGDATAKLGIMSGNIVYYDLETGAQVGSQNNVTLEIGKWYRVEQNKNNAANITTAWTFGFLGDASHNAGNVSASFRNIEAVYPGEAEVSFNLNYAGATGAPATIVVAEGSAYGELPTVSRVGYTFGGWYTEAACTNAVTASNIVSASHTLYAKWTIAADTNLLQPSYTTETGFTGVTREFIDGKDTVIFTTEGKSLTNTGWQRRLEFVNGDTTKEIVKFRFKYVANNDAEGNAVAPAINYFVNGLNDTNYGHFAITDENGNVVAPTALETGKWYIFYGRTQGYSRIVLYPCNTTEQLRTTLYIQDRELLDYDEPIYVQQAAHAYYGNTAPYQDAEGNWLIHFRSFTGAEHHGNTAEGRQTDIHFNGTYTAATFEFKFNVSQYAASGEALADKIDLASMLNASYFDLDGKAVAIADMKVGQWYRVVIAANAGENLPTYDRFYIQGYTNGTNGNTVNIDMDMRNFVGYNYSWGVDSG